MYDHHLTNLKLKLLKSNKGEGAYILSEIKEKYNNIIYGEIIRSIKNKNNYYDYFYNELFPSSYDDMITKDCINTIANPKLKSSLILKELCCFIEFLNVFEDEISIFNSFRKQFELNLFSDKTEIGLSYLDKLEQSLGLSFWLVESKLLSLNIKDSVRVAEEEYQIIKNQCSNFYVKTFIRTIRRRTNIYLDNKGVIEFINQKRRLLLESDYEDVLCDYYYFYNNVVKCDLYDITQMLKMASKLNLVDMYILVSKLLEIVFSQRILTPLEEKRLIQCIRKSKVDFSVKKIHNYPEKNNDILTLNIYEMKKCICEKRFSDCTNLCASVLRDNINFELILILSICNVYLGKEMPNSLLGLISNCIKELILKNAKIARYIKYINLLRNLFLALNSLSINNGYRNFFSFFVNSDQDCYFLDIVSRNYYSFEALAFFSYDNSFLRKSASCDLNWYNNTSVFPFLKYDVISEEIHGINQLSIIELHKYFESGNNILFEIENEIIRSFIANQLFDKYVENNDFLEAIKIYNYLQFESKFRVIAFNYNELKRKINYKEVINLYGDIDFCIFAHLTNFLSTNGMPYNTHVKNSINSIIKNNNIDCLSDIQFEENELNRRKYCYLFRHVCTEEMIRINNQSNYRIRNASLSDKELILFERKKLLQRALLLSEDEQKEEIDTQLRFLDESIKALEDNKLKEEYEFKQRILSASINVSETDLLIPLYERFMILKNETQVIKISSGEYLSFRDAFVNFKKAYIYSLNKQLGINIRHSFFATRIIEFFEQFGLTIKMFDELTNTQKNKKKQELIEKKLLGLIPHIDRIYLFSCSLYNLIEEERIKIYLIPSSIQKTDSHYVYIDDNNILKIYSRLKKTRNIYEFQSELFSLVNDLFNSILIRIGKTTYTSIINSCSKLLLEYFSDISNEINLKEILNELPDLAKEISEWFGFIKQTDYKYNLERYMNHLQKKYPSICKCELVNPQNNVLDIKQKHCFDLLLHNLVRNAIEHSGFSESHLNINVWLKIDKQTIELYFCNNLYNKKKDEIIESIARIKNNIKNRKNITKENRRGNGFLLIADYLDDLNYIWNIHFYEEDIPTKFSLKITIDGGKNV